MKNHYLLILLLLFISCNKTKNTVAANDNVSSDTEVLDRNAILTVDVTKKYPKGELIYIQDFADASLRTKS